MKILKTDFFYRLVIYKKKKLKMQNVERKLIIRFSIMIFCGILISGCSTKGPLFTKKQFPSYKLSTSDYQVIFKDSRTQIDNRDINVPFFTWPGDHDKVSPELAKDLIDAFHKVAKLYIEPSGPPLKFEIELIEGMQSFKNPGIGESESVSVKLKMNIIDGKTGMLKYSSSGECWGDRWSLDASFDRIQEMYKKAFELALIDAFEAISK